jgi:hypothetical protein
MKSNFIAVIFLWISISSCSTSSIMKSRVNPKEINELAVIEPFSFISYIEKGNKAFPNDTLSMKSSRLMREVIDLYKPSIPLSEETLEVYDFELRNKLIREVKTLMYSAQSNRQVSSLRITPLLDSLLVNNDKRFGLVMVNTGFTRRPGNYGNQIAKGVAMGVLTLGMYYETPIKSNSTLYAMILDSEQKNVTFFRRSMLPDKDPMNEAVLKRQMYDIFKGYFFTVN